MNWLLPLYIICASLRLIVYTGFSCCTVAVRGTPPWECDIWIGRTESSEEQHVIRQNVYCK